MKRLRVFPLLLLVAFALSACATQAVAQLAQLPDEGRNLVFILLSAVITWLLLKLSEKTGVDLGGYANAVATALAPIIVTLIESALNLIDPVFDNIVLTVIHLIVLLVGSIGTFFLFKRKAPSLRG